MQKTIELRHNGTKIHRKRAKETNQYQTGGAGMKNIYATWDDYGNFSVSSAVCPGQAFILRWFFSFLLQTNAKRAG